MVDREYSKSEWFINGSSFNKSYKSTRCYYAVCFIVLVCEFCVLNYFLYKVAPLDVYYLLNCLFAVILILVVFIGGYNIIKTQFVSVYTKYSLARCTVLSATFLKVDIDGVGIEDKLPRSVKSVLLDCFLIQSALRSGLYDFKTVMTTYSGLFNPLDFAELMKLNGDKVEIYLDLYYTKKESKLLSVDIYFKMGDNPPVKVIQ